MTQFMEFKTEAGAKRAVKRLSLAWPQTIFTVVPSANFDYMIRADIGDRVAYVAKGKIPQPLLADFREL
jgi:hypothetical protein